MSLHTWRHQGPCKPSSCAIFMLNPHWGRPATGKKKSVYAHRVTSVMSNSWQPCGLPGFSDRGFLQSVILERNWPILVAIPF